VVPISEAFSYRDGIWSFQNTGEFLGNPFMKKTVAPGAVGKGLYNMRCDLVRSGFKTLYSRPGPKGGPIPLK
jgi:hypothetical protein